MAIHWREDTINPNPYVPPEPPISPEQYQELLDEYTALQEDYSELEGDYATLQGQLETASGYVENYKDFIENDIVDMIVPPGTTSFSVLMTNAAALRRVYIPESVVSNQQFGMNAYMIGYDHKGSIVLQNGMFNGCTSLAALRLNETSTTEWKSATSFINGCAVLELLELPSGLQKISKSLTASSNTSLKAVVMPASLTNIATAQAFSGIPADCVAYVEGAEGSITGSGATAALGSFAKVVYEYKTLPDTDPDIVFLNGLKAARDAILDGPLEPVEELETLNLSKIQTMVLDGRLDTQDEDLAASLQTLGIKQPTAEINPVKPGSGNVSI